MAHKPTILFITGTRAEYGLSKSTIADLKKSKKFKLQILVTGMHTLVRHGNTLDEVKKDFKVDFIIPIAEADSMVDAFAKEVAGINTVLVQNTINALILVGDRGESLAAAISALHQNIPLIHISGGDISGPSVDHYIRNALTIFAKLHLVQTIKSAENVIKLGAHPKQVHVVGSMGLNGLDPKKLYSKNKIAAQLKLNVKIPWLLVAMHPTLHSKTSMMDQISGLTKSLRGWPDDAEKICEIIIIYPNSDTGASVFIEELESLKDTNAKFYKNLEFKLFLSLIYYSNVYVGNSSSGLMEAGYLKKPFVNIGDRQLGREQSSNVINVAYDARSVTKGIQKAFSADFKEQLDNSASVYKGGNVSQKIKLAIEKFIS